MKTPLQSLIISVLLTLVIGSAATLPLRAQSTEPFNDYSVFKPSAEAWQMTRQGGLTPSLYTGTMNWSLPLYVYEDPDFRIPLSLDYSFGGYRPSQRSGVAGYGWALNCGGAITREVRGLPDEGINVQDGLYYRPVKGWPETGAAGLSPSATNLCSVHCPFMVPTNNDGYISAFQGYDPFSDNPVIDNNGGSLYDTAPDIFHFTIPGHSGDFLFLQDGTVRVSGSDLPWGEVSVVMNHPSLLPEETTFTITTGDGYSYSFEPDGVNLTTNTASMQRPIPAKSVTGWRLSCIEAPNGRKVELVYTSLYSKSAAVWYTPKHSGNAAINGQSSMPFDEPLVRGCNPVEEEYKALDNIVVKSPSGTVEASISFSYATAGSNENAPSCFCETEMQTNSRGSGPQHLLQSITVYDKDDDTVESFTLTYQQAGSGVPKSFLSSVAGRRMGLYSFSYNLTQALPLNDTPGVDHWGFWNGGNCSTLPSHVNDPVPDTAPGSLYSQMNDSSKNPDPQKGAAGALTRITYPTGGTTDISYEANTVRRRLDLTSSGTGVELTSAATGNGTMTVGGVRVHSVSDSDDSSIVRTTEFSYTDASGLASGILMQMPRYVQSAAYTQYAQTNLYLIHCSVQTNNITAYDHSGVSCLSQDYHVAYTSVGVEHPDGSLTRHDFSSVADSGLMDWRAGGTWVQKRVVSSADHLDDSGHGAHDLTPVSEDMRNMRGKPLSELTLDSYGNPVRKVEYTYGTDRVTVSGTAYNQPVRYLTGNFSYTSPVLQSETVTDWADDGTSVTTVRSLAYNAKGQLSRERTSSPQSQGEERTTYLTYYHESGESASSTALPGALRRAVRSHKAGGTEYVTAAEVRQYASPSVHTQPSAIVAYGFATPKAVSSEAQARAAWSYGTSSQTSFTRNSLYRITRVNFPGSAWAEYTWSGNYIVSVKENGSGNAATYEWKPLVGPTLIREPSGRQNTYEYDGATRLHIIRDGKGKRVMAYNYALRNEAPSSPSRSGNRTPEAAESLWLQGLSSGENYIQVTTFLDEVAFLKRDVTYYDALGYPVQEVAVAASPASGGSIVRPLVYDALHRDDATSYLPYARSDWSAAIEPTGTVLSSQTAFYYSQYGDSHPWSVKEYGDSQYGRVREMRREGDAWASGNHSSTAAHSGYSTSEKVLKFQYIPASGSTPAQVKVRYNVNYASGALRRVRTTSEDGAVSDTFTDASGLIVCTRAWDGYGATGDSADTYYVRDLRDSTVLVIQPEGAHAIGMLLDEGVTQLTLTLACNPSSSYNDIYSDFCFGYTYDARGNALTAHVPGGGSVERVFDARRRTVLETNTMMSEVDADSTALSAPRYIYTEYDDYDRVTRRTVVRTSASLSSMRQSCSSSAGVPYSVRSGFTTVCTLYTAEYFPFGSVSGALSGFSAESGVVSSSDVETSAVKGMLRSETIYPAPGADGTAPAAGGVSHTRSYYYDYRGRTVQVKETGSDGWVSRYSTKFDFTGNVLASRERHEGPDGDDDQWLTCNYTYDSRGRMTSCDTSFDGYQVAPVTYSYDALGNMTGKTLGASGGPSGSQTFTYDLHGWGTGSSATYQGSPLFSETLRYASPSRSAVDSRYDGSISEVSFGSYNGTNTLSLETYGYAYDGMGRLTDALHFSGSSTSSDGLRTERDITYDRNGNVTGVDRFKNASYERETLEFTLSGNRVTDWTDNYATDQGSYGYDAAGNLASDSHKGLLFSYNLANLPSKVEGVGYNAGLTYSYGYLSDGTKTSADCGSGSTALGLRYRGSFVYETVGSVERLQSISWPEGRIVLEYDGNDTEPCLVSYDWLVTDHLGSVRAIAGMRTGSTGVKEVNGYLPFGTRLPGTLQSSGNRHRFGGKEEQRIGSTDLKLLDFGARYYDAFACRWTSIDPLAWKYPAITPYSYCAGNPVNLVDPEGEDWYENNETHSFTWFDDKNDIDGYTYYGPQGSLLGEFESMINDFLIETHIQDEGIFKEGFTLSIRDSEEGIFSKGCQSGLLKEFVTNTGPEFSIFLQDHPMTEAIMNESIISTSEKELRSGADFAKGYRIWTLGDVPIHFSLTKQFVGSFSYRGKSKGPFIYHLVEDSKSRHSLFLHVPSNKSRDQSRLFGNTYQFYLSIRNK